MDETAKRIQEQVEQVQAVYEEGRRSVAEFARSASESSKRALIATDRWVHTKPWTALGTAASVGLLLGLWLAQSLQE